MLQEAKYIILVLSEIPLAGYVMHPKRTFLMCLSLILFAGLFIGLIFCLLLPVLCGFYPLFLTCHQKSSSFMIVPLGNSSISGRTEGLSDLTPCSSLGQKFYTIALELRIGKMTCFFCRDISTFPVGTTDDGRP